MSRADPIPRDTESDYSPEQAASSATVQLLIDYDDGFVAYLNGVEVARRNLGAPGAFAWHDQHTFNTRSAGTAETISLGPAGEMLHGGVNAMLWDHIDQIEAEILRLLPILKENGGYIFQEDHSIPDSVSLDNYKRILQVARRIGTY